MSDDDELKALRLSDKDAWWEKRKQQMFERSQRAKSAGEYVPVTPKVFNAKVPALECNPSCLLCHGDGIIEDGQGHAMECPKITEMKRNSGD